LLLLRIPLESRVLDTDHALDIVGERQVPELLRKSSLVQQPDAMGSLVFSSRLPYNGTVFKDCVTSKQSYGDMTSSCGSGSGGEDPWPTIMHHKDPDRSNFICEMLTKH
jgi:hypothetical protein